MNRITAYQWVLIGAAFTLDATIITLPGQVIGTAGIDAWLAYLLSSAVIFVGFCLLLRVLQRFPGQDMFEALNKHFGFFGKFIVIMYLLFFLFILSRDIRMTADFVHITLLINTPTKMIAALLIITIMLIIKKGIFVAARLTEIWLPVLLIVLFVLPIIISRDYQFQYLGPSFPNGITPVLQGSWLLLPYLGEVIGLAFIAKGQKIKLHLAILPLLLGVATLLLLHYQTILTLGRRIPTMTLYPTYELVRQIRLTDFLDRFDLFLVGLWLPTMITKVSYSLYLVMRAMHSLFPNAQSRITILPVGMLCFTSCLILAENPLVTMRFNETWPAIGIVFQLAIPVLLFFFLRPKQANRLG